MAEDKKLLEKFRKLHEAQKAATADYREKMDAIAREIDTLLGGGEGVGAVLKRLETFYSDAWRVRYDNPYTWNYVVDRAQWKRLLKTLSVDEIEKRVLNYLRSSDEFYKKARHSFGIFVRSINQLAAEAKDTPDLELQPDGWGPCLREGKHTPVCKSDQEHTRRRTTEMRA